MTITETEREPARALRVVEPLLGAEAALQKWRDYQELVRRLLEPSDYQSYIDKRTRETKRFKKKSAWRKLRKAFGFDLEMRDERIGHGHHKTDCVRLIVPEERDCGCPTVYARYIVRATDPGTGQFVDGVGVCSTGEKERVFTKPDHEIPATAFTRAANRAISDLIGAGEDSAEEVRGTPEAPGIPLEDREAIKAAWNTAPGDRRDRAIARMRDWGFAGGNVAGLFTDFAARAGENAVADLLAILNGTEAEPFDPDATPAANGAP
jgi:hypothetical protein